MKTSGIDSPGKQLIVGAQYRVGLGITANGTAHAGFSALGSIPVPDQQVSWAKGAMDTLQIGTTNNGFAFVIDDVVVSTKGLE